MDKAYWQEILKNLPTNPGVYLFHDEDDTIIYVGKAKNLKRRVSSYFRPTGLAPKTLAMRDRARWVETIIVDSPSEALLLECNLIKLHRPHYNIMLKDDKTYPYLKLTLNEEFPRLLVTRRLRNDGSRYFGPYTNVGAMNDSVALLREIFPLRTCGTKPGRIKGRACLNYHIKTCSAPCIDNISKEDYRKIAVDVEKFLSGDGNKIKTELNTKMLAASEALDFESAAHYRDLISAIDTTLEKQKITSTTSSEDRDFISIYCKGDVGVATVFFVRGGKLFGRENQRLERVAETPLESLYSLFITSFYSGDRPIPREIVVSVMPEDSDILTSLFKERRGSSFAFTVPQRGQKARMLELAAQNGALVLDEAQRSKKGNDEEIAKALEELRLELHLKNTPQRIECYDISHIQGTNVVGSMIVFEDGVPCKKEYRKFKIKTVEGNNDFASLAEVLERRLTRGVEEHKFNNKEGFGHLPDLVIIDGGKGQLNSVLPIKNRLTPQIPFISLAKREEEVMVPWQDEPVLLTKEGPAYHLIQRIRDEAHRFAITFHRSLRGKAQTKSVLDDIPGIGEKRRKALLRHFGTVKNIAKANIAELALVPAMNQEAAESVYDFFRLREAKDKNE